VDGRYLDVEDLLRIIELEDIGPVRDLGLLDSATARARSSAFGIEAYSTLPEKAAALLDSIVGNHALVDATNASAGWPPWPSSGSTSRSCSHPGRRRRPGHQRRRTTDPGQRLGSCARVMVKTPTSG
jgi:hypothetical protein